MAVITVSSTKKFYRKGLGNPIFSATGQNGLAKWYIKNNVYLPVSGVYEFEPLNRTQLLNAQVRDLVTGSFTTIANVTNTSNTFKKTTSAGYAGVNSTYIYSGNTSIEGKHNSGYSVISLQNVTAVDSLSNFTTLKHALRFDLDGMARISENGIDISEHPTLPGDTALIELVDGVVRYWLVGTDNKMRLLRATRSTLSYPIVPSVYLYYINDELGDVRVWNGNEGSKNLQTFGILNNFQDWKNPAQYESLADKTMAKDKIEKFTYFTQERNLRTLSINLEWRFEDEYFEFLDFFRFHDINREFIFADYARKKFNGAPNFQFMKFVGSFKDDPLGMGLFGMSTDLRDILKSQMTPSHYLALEVPDEIAPMPPTGLAVSGSNIILTPPSDSDLAGYIAEIQYQ